MSELIILTFFMIVGVGTLLLVFNAIVEKDREYIQYKNSYAQINKGRSHGVEIQKK